MKNVTIFSFTNVNLVSIMSLKAGKTERIDNETENGDEKMDEMLKIGIVGAGMMGYQHAEAIRRISGTEIVALAAGNLEHAKKAARELFIPHVYESVEEMLDKEQLDAIHICTPNQTHYAMCKAALQAGVNVFCEKPLANTSDETEELVQLANEKGLVAGVNFNYRQNVMVREMHERLMQSKWGRTLLIRGEYIQDWMMYDTDYNWRCIPEINGPSRTVADIGSHWFDAVQYITGMKVKRVFAKLITVYPQRKKYDIPAGTFGTQGGETYTLVDITSEDAAQILFEMEDGTPGMLMLSQVSAGYKNGLVIHLDGTEESLTWEQENPDKLWIRTREDGALMTYAEAGAMHGEANNATTLPAGHAVGWAEGVRNSVRAFYNQLSGKEPSGYASFADGDGIVRIVEACLRSNASGTWEEVQGGEG